MKKVRKSPKRKPATSTAHTTPLTPLPGQLSTQGTPPGRADLFTGSTTGGNNETVNGWFSLPPPPVLTNKSSFIDYIKYGLLYFNQHVQFLNNSKIFAGIIVITLNIAGKFVNFKLSKTMESYLKHTFSRNILIFCIAWMGSREIYVAIIITLLCILLLDFVCNESSGYCMLPESFTSYHMSLLENNAPSKEEVEHAKEVLKKAGEKLEETDS